MNLGEIMYCKFCGKKLKEKELVCDLCSNNAKRKLSKLKTILHILSILVSFILMVGMINDGDYISVLCFVVCLIFLIPVVARFLYDKLKINRLIKYLLIIVMFLIGMVSSSSFKEMLLEENNSDKGTIIEKSEDKEQDVEVNEKTEIDDKKKKILKTNSDEYYEYLNTAFKYATENNEYWYYSGANMYYPYIHFSIKPRKEMSESVQIEQAKIVGQKLIAKLDDYEYKSGNIFTYNYDTISVYFHYYMYGQMSRNGGPFIQFSIYDVSELNIDEIIS